MSVFSVVFLECKLVNMSVLGNQLCSVLGGCFDYACYYWMLLSCGKVSTYHCLGLVLCPGSRRFPYYIR